jgi:DNA-binding HxlR family transcriptional regulator
MTKRKSCLERQQHIVYAVWRAEALLRKLSNRDDPIEFSMPEVAYYTGLSKSSFLMRRLRELVSSGLMTEELVASGGGRPRFQFTLTDSGRDLARDIDQIPWML